MIGGGRGTCILDEFDKAEAIFIFGQNTGSNSPRMMTNLAACHKGGIPIVAIKPMSEREAAGEQVLDRDFIAQHRLGLDAVRDDVMAQDWTDIVAHVGVTEEQIRQGADAASARRGTAIEGLQYFVFAS